MTTTDATRPAATAGRADAFRAAVYASLLAGVLSAFVKLGWEQLLPPRTPDRTEPPLLLLEKLGLPVDSATFTFSGTEVNWASLLVHFGFSVATVAFYCLVAVVWPRITVAWGAVYGLVVLVVFHGLALPALGLTPAPWDLPGAEWLSEALGHVVWLVAAEFVRRGVVASRRR